MEKFVKTAGTDADDEDNFREAAAFLLGFLDMEDEEDKVKKISEIFAAEGEDEEVKVGEIVDAVMSGDSSKIRPVGFVKNLAIFLARFFDMDEEGTAEKIAKIVMPDDEDDDDIDIDIVDSIVALATIFLMILEMRGEEEGVIRERIAKLILAKDDEADDDCYEIDPTTLFRTPALILLGLLGMEEEEDKVGKIVELMTTKVSGHDDDCFEITRIDFARKLHISDSDDVVVVAERGPVALRDFPHPRHLCKNNPFESTPHETYCSKCFCSVCEIPAPCREWKGTSRHCNITKK